MVLDERCIAKPSYDIFNSDHQYPGSNIRKSSRRHCLCRMRCQINPPFRPSSTCMKNFPLPLCRHNYQEAPLSPIPQLLAMLNVIGIPRRIICTKEYVFTPPCSTLSLFIFSQPSLYPSFRSHANKSLQPHLTSSAYRAAPVGPSHPRPRCSSSSLSPRHSAVSAVRSASECL